MYFIFVYKNEYGMSFIMISYILLLDWLFNMFMKNLNLLFTQYRSHCILKATACRLNFFEPEQKRAANQCYPGSGFQYISGLNPSANGTVES